MSEPAYKRILLKVSGEALAGAKKVGIDDEVLAKISATIKEVSDLGVEVAVVVGGGNFWRGRTGNEIERVKSDQIGMLATVMNCIYVSEIFRSEGMMTSVLTPFEIGGITKLFSKDRADKYFAHHMVVFFAGGTGHPFFSTDTGVVLRAVETGADMILMAKNVDGIYDSDPVKNPAAKRFDTISLSEMISRNLQAIDMSSAILAKENQMPIRVFALQEENSIIRAAGDTFNGTTILPE